MGCRLYIILFPYKLVVLGGGGLNPNVPDIATIALSLKIHQNPSLCSINTEAHLRKRSGAPVSHTHTKKEKIKKERKKSAPACYVFSWNILPFSGLDHVVEIH